MTLSILVQFLEIFSQIWAFFNSLLVKSYRYLTRFLQVLIVTIPSIPMA